MFDCQPWCANLLLYDLSPVLFSSPLRQQRAAASLCVGGARRHEEEAKKGEGRERQEEKRGAGRGGKLKGMSSLLAGLNAFVVCCLLFVVVCCLLFVVCCLLLFVVCVCVVCVVVFVGILLVPNDRRVYETRQ